MPVDLFQQNNINSGNAPQPVDLFQHAGINVPLPQQQTNPSLPLRIAGDIGAGLGQGLTRFENLINPNDPLLQKLGITSPTNTQLSQLFGVKNPNFADTLAQGAVSYAPYAMAAPASMLGQGLAGAAYGGGQPTNRLQGAVVGAGTALAGGTAANILGKGAGMLFGTQNAQNMLGNVILKHLTGASETGGALSPEQTAENLATNYTDANGNRLPVDIGTLANSGTLKGIYQGLKYIPFSGVGKNINILNKQISDKNIANAQQQLTTASSSPIVSNLNDQINALRTQQQPYTDAINNAPNYLNNLSNQLGNRANLTQSLTNSTKSIYQANKAASTQDYAPINQSTIRLDQLGIDKPFPNYTSAATSLLVNRENLTNLFGDDKDLGAQLNSELDKAQGVIGNSSNYGMTLPEAVQRIQNLGRLSASATGAGRRYEGMLLGNLRDGLSTDVNNALTTSGNGDIAQQLQTANTNFKNNVVPFWQNNEIRKSVTSPGYISPGAKLATALHDPNNQSILNQLPNNAQNSALYQMITRGKGTSSGMTNMDTPAIASAYAKIPVDAKTQIASYNPQADSYFENLPKILNTNANIETAKSSLGKQLQSAASIQKNNIDNLQSQLENLKNQQFGSNSETGAAGQKLAHVAEGGGALALAHFVSPYAMAALPVTSLLSRTVAKTMNNPDLINAYINRARMPAQESIKNPLLNRILPSIGTQQSVDRLGGQ